MEAQNLFSDIPGELPEEFFTTLLSAKNLRIERIVSQGQASPPGFWYDQAESEWVVVLEGSADIQFEGDPEPARLRRGSCLSIPAHARHRVLWTDPSQRTIWLAIHYGG
ncbi:MAG: cupin domain-containing protein [Thermoguttaceae bacterium]|jgi:cupin 2 domain-containing protein